MEFITTDLLWSLLTIIFIDLILAGDNAIVIGMAARQLPAEQQKKAIFWGTAGAISIRLVSSLIVIWLLQIPALMMTGGVLLIWIAYKLLTDKKDHNTIASHTSLSAAVRTIVIADGVMGIDNVMAVAGVAHGDLVLVATGILITIPLIIWGSTAFIRIVDRYPIVVYAGGAILAWTAGGMIAGDSLIAKYIPLLTQLKWIFSLTIVAAVLGAAILNKRHTVNAQSHIDNDQTIRGEHQA
ncbi:TerC family protein [Sporomusa aerivorans]|uniref:TerC family protein n=1 Tax=Sporomusa aerivorans TaxID=204936 RepID=UPI00352A94E2